MGRWATAGRRLAPLLAALALSMAAPAGAEQASPLPVNATEAERRAYELYNADRLLTARRIAEQELERHPDSIVAHYIVGVVYRRAEGNLPNAMFHLGRARELYETRFGTTRAGAWMLHREILFAIQQVAGEMEEWDYQLHVIEFYDMLYDPDLYAEHAWPLIQLGRYDLARRFAEVASRSRDAFQRSLGLNALCAIEGEAQRRLEYYEACTAAFENAQARASVASDEGEAQAVTVHAYNAALSALAVLRPDQAEERLRLGARRLEMTPANPWRLLTRITLDQGRTEDAVEALREMHRWRTRQPPHLRNQDRAETDAVFATVLLAAGETEVGIRAVTRAIDRPDRRGLTSSQAEQAQGAHALLRRALLKTRLAREAEEVSTRGFFARLFGTVELAWSRLELWPDKERVVSVLSDEEILSATLQIHVQGGLEPTPVWLLGDLVEVLGSGVVDEALERVSALDRFNGIEPYRQALRAEVALSRGDERRALSLAKQALTELPSTEALLQARVAALGAEAARREGRAREALGLFERAMQTDGGVIRRLDLAIPATVVNRSQGRTGHKVASMLRRSPRLSREEDSFRVEVSGDDLGLQICLQNRRGERVRCTERLEPIRPSELPEDTGDNDEASAAGEEEEETPVEPETSQQFARRVALAFHDRAFTVPVQLSTADMSSLDGRIRVDEEAARRRLRGVLDQVIEENETTR